MAPGFDALPAGRVPGVTELLKPAKAQVGPAEVDLHHRCSKTLNKDSARTHTYTRAMKLQPTAVAALIFVVCLVIHPPGAERRSSEDDVLTDANRTTPEHSDAVPNIDAVSLGGLGMGDGGGGGGGGGGMGGSAHGTGSFSFVVVFKSDDEQYGRTKCGRCHIATLSRSAKN